jgi:hypothetical protein
MKIQYPAERCIAIWIGSFSTEQQMDECIDKDIEPSLALPFPISSICEVSFEDTPVSIRQLIEGFSGWSTYVDKACDAAQKLCVSKANGALICFYLRCDAPTNQWGCMTFLGNFEGQDTI